MIIVKLKGGLGNQMFQYAFGRLIAIRRDEELFLDKNSLGAKKDSYRRYGLSHFNIRAKEASLNDINKYRYQPGIIAELVGRVKNKIFRLYNIGWDPKILQSKQKYFDGFWQSYRYPDQIRESLLKEFTLVNSIDNKYQDVLKEMENTNSISLHIRRGDYITDAKTSKAHNVCDLQYYKKAIEIMANRIDNPNFFFFSDDIEWVKQNLHINYPISFVSNSNMKDYEELVIMSWCKHNIIANSSFSWWGAWLNQNKDKVVVAPKKWNNLYQKEYKYLIPENWIKI